MRIFRQEMWSYAVLLIVLFAIAAVAVSTIIEYAHERSYSPGVMETLILTLTLGFMLIAGAFGLWAIQFAAERESRRRVGRFVDAMDYLSDGLLAVDRKGRITGSNPAARRFAPEAESRNASLADAFPCLSAADTALLLDRGQPNEVEKKWVSGDATRTLRFRSQPSEDLGLVLISDVTTMEAKRQHGRQVARLQLIGQIARGVANDFNNLLCAISGHASLLARARTTGQETEDSCRAIADTARKGVALAGHLLDLSASPAPGASALLTANHIHAAADALRNNLTPGWLVDLRVEESLPSVGVTGLQIEQVVVNLGFLLADALSGPGCMWIRAFRPRQDRERPPPPCAVVVRMAAAAPGRPAPRWTADDAFAVPSDSAPPAGEDPAHAGGVIEPVVRSMLQEAGGDLRCAADPDAPRSYVVFLPHPDLAASRSRAAPLPQELGVYLANWTVLLAGPHRSYALLEKRLLELGVRAHAVDNIASALARVEESQNLDALVLDEYLVRQETRALLKALIKLRPTLGIVVLSEDPGAEPRKLLADVVFESVDAAPDRVLMAMVEAKSLALRREVRA